MDNKLKIGLIAAAVAVVAIIVFNFLPGSIRSAGTIGFLAGVVSGWFLRSFYARGTAPSSTKRSTHRR